MLTTHTLSCQLPGRCGLSDNGVLCSLVELKELLNHQVTLRPTYVVPTINIYVSKCSITVKSKDHNKIRFISKKIIFPISKYWLCHKNRLCIIFITLSRCHQKYNMQAVPCKTTFRKSCALYLGNYDK
jgi:hypothetical protein